MKCDFDCFHCKYPDCIKTDEEAMLGRNLEKRRAKPIVKPPVKPAVKPIAKPIAILSSEPPVEITVKYGKPKKIEKMWYPGFKSMVVKI